MNIFQSNITDPKKQKWVWYQKEETLISFSMGNFLQENHDYWYTYEYYHQPFQKLSLLGTDPLFDEYDALFDDFSVVSRCLFKYSLNFFALSVSLLNDELCLQEHFLCKVKVVVENLDWFFAAIIPHSQILKFIEAH